MVIHVTFVFSSSNSRSVENLAQRDFSLFYGTANDLSEVMPHIKCVCVYLWRVACGVRVGFMRSVCVRVCVCVYVEITSCKKSQNNKYSSNLKISK